SDAIDAQGLSSTIKWPNDVLVSGKKVAGILAECATIENRVDYVILGFGVNLNVTRRELAQGPAPLRHPAGPRPSLRRAQARALGARGCGRQHRARRRRRL